MRLNTSNSAGNWLKSLLSHVYHHRITYISVLPSLNFLHIVQMSPCEKPREAERDKEGGERTGLRRSEDQAETWMAPIDAYYL